MHRSRFSTGRLAAFVGRSPATIRRYEASGIIPPARRDPISRRRVWTRAQADAIRRKLLPAAAGTACTAKSARTDEGVDAQPERATRTGPHATD